MTQYVTEKDVRDIAEYARIGLADDELPQMTEDLNNIIESLKPITEYDLEGVKPTFHPIGSIFPTSCERIVEVPGFTQEEALSNAPKQQDGYFLIPSILGGGEAVMAEFLEMGIAEIQQGV
jgi:aspartyl-tRNA(Asn)/glutamyl-tRNA(Gln) amidotransferase subunit C